MSQAHNSFVFSTTDNFEQIPSQQWMRKNLPDLLLKYRPSSSSVICEIGVGNGEFLSYLSSRGFKVTGIEPSSTGFAIAKEKFPKLHIHNIAAEDPYPKEIKECELYICLEVIEHVFSPRKFLTSIYDQIPNNSTLIISTPYHGYLKNLCLSILNLWDRHFTVGWECGHIKFFSKKTLRSLSEGAGFSVEKVQCYGRIPYLWRSMIFVLRK